MIIGFAGSGNMAAALARGLADAEVEGLSMLFTDSGSGRAAELAGEVGGEARDSNAELASEAELLILAVKPAALETAAEELSEHRGPLVSVLAATSLEQLREAFPGKAILRTMPNVAVEVGKGVICHASDRGDADPLADALGLLGRIARLHELPEDQLDAATAIMGCSGAYMALNCQALIDAGVEAGIDAETAKTLVAETAWGTGELLLDRDPEALAEAIASPGGSTEAGIKALEKAGGPKAMKAAVEASLKRMSKS